MIQSRSGLRTMAASKQVEGSHEQYAQAAKMTALVNCSVECAGCRVCLSRVVFADGGTHDMAVCRACHFGCVVPGVLAALGRTNEPSFWYALEHPRACLVYVPVKQRREKSNSVMSLRAIISQPYRPHTAVWWATRSGRASSTVLFRDERFTPRLL